MFRRVQMPLFHFKTIRPGAFYGNTGWRINRIVDGLTQTGTASGADHVRNRADFRCSDRVHDRFLKFTPIHADIRNIDDDEQYL